MHWLNCTTCNLAVHRSICLTPGAENGRTGRGLWPRGYLPQRWMDPNVYCQRDVFKICVAFKTPMKELIRCCPASCCAKGEHRASQGRESFAKGTRGVVFAKGCEWPMLNTGCLLNHPRKLRERVSCPKVLRERKTEECAKFAKGRERVRPGKHGI